jgi:hypothetical protein
MFEHYVSDPVVRLIGRVLFPEAPAHVRRKDTRFLFLSLVLGAMICTGFGWVLFVLNQQGRL